MGAEQSIDRSHVRNTFIDFDTRGFDKEFVTDPRRCKSVPSTPLRTPRKCQSLPNLLVPSNSRGSNSRSASHEENADTIFRDDVSCKTADPMDDQVQLDGLYGHNAFSGFQVVVPAQTVQQFLEEGTPHANVHAHNSLFEMSNRVCTEADWQVPDGAMTDSFIPWREQIHSHSYVDMQSMDMCPASWHELDRSPSSDVSPTYSPNRKRQSLLARDMRHHGNASKVDRSTWTCRMLRNVPNDYSRGDLCEMLDSNGVQYNFAYLPIDWGKRANLGYAFVNLKSHAEAERVEEVLGRFSDWKVASEKVCEVAWAKPEQQSLHLIVESFKNNPVMHPDVPEEFKPLLFNAWKQHIEFPPPTKALRPPRGFLRKQSEEQMMWARNDCKPLCAFPQSRHS